MQDRIVLENVVCCAVIEEAALNAETINPGNYSPEAFTKVVRVSASMLGASQSITILCNYMSSLDNSAILKGSQLILMLNEQLFEINLQTCTIQKYRKLDIIGGTFGLYETAHGYVIHAELDILMLNPDFEILWDFSGRDIFVSVTGKTAFTLTDTAVQLYDFNDNYYELDLNGKLLSEQQK